MASQAELVFSWRNFVTYLQGYIFFILPPPRGTWTFTSLESRRVCLPPLRGTHLTLQPSFKLLLDKGISKAKLGFPEQNHTEGAKYELLVGWGKNMMIY